MITLPDRAGLGDVIVELAVVAGYVLVLGGLMVYLYERQVTA